MHHIGFFLSVFILNPHAGGHGLSKRNHTTVKGGIGEACKRITVGATKMRWPVGIGKKQGLMSFPSADEFMGKFLGGFLGHDLAAVGQIFPKQQDEDFLCPFG